MERLRRTMMFVPGANAAMLRDALYMVRTPLCLIWKILFLLKKRMLLEH